MSGLVLLAASAALLWAGESPEANVTIHPRPRPAHGRTADIRVNSTLVLIPVSVTDPLGRPVAGLERKDFHLFDGDVEQKVTQFSGEDAPLAIGIVLDLSGTMSDKLKKARAAVAQFMETANPQDEFFLVEFSDRAKLTVGLTGNSQEIDSRLAGTRAQGRTALLDAVYLALQVIRKSAKPRKALLIISDGGDNYSRYSRGEVKELAMESDTLIYAMGIFGPAGIGWPTLEERSGPALLSELAEQTGGRSYPVKHLDQLPEIASRIGTELRNRYVLGFSPPDAGRDGKYHRVRVQLSQPPGLPPLHTLCKPGYYAPGE